jgi:Outer membrane protein beta-barrel domain
MKRYLLANILLVNVVMFGQYHRKDSNRIGISFGINQLSITTPNFDTKPEIGIQGGLSVRGNFYNDFDMVYGMQFSETKFSLETNNLSTSKTEKLIYKLPSAQISLMLSYKIAQKKLTVEAGPVIQFNDKLKIDSNFENNTIVKTSLLAKDILDISKFNTNFGVGITAGVTHFKANIQYQYGVNNMLSRLNNQNISSVPKFKGHVGILSASLIVYL